MRRYDAEVGMIQGAISGHVMSERRSRSFDFRTPGKGSTYAFVLTWSPGSVNLSGDLGELTVTHWHALHDFAPGMRWMADSHLDYLLRKTGAQDEVDPEATARFIIEIAQQELSFGDHSRLDRLKEIHRPKYSGIVMWHELEVSLRSDFENMSSSQIAEDCRGIYRLDDFYGAYRTPPRAVHQITALQYAAKMIVATLPDEQVAT